MDRISVVIVTRNRPHMIGDTLGDLLASDDPGCALEILVVDQSDDRRTAEVVGELARSDTRLRYLPTSTRGIAKARNLGLTASRGAVIAYTDDDCRVPGNWLATVVDAFRSDPELGALYGRVLPAKDDQPEPGAKPIAMRPYTTPRYFRSCPSFVLRNVFGLGGSNNMAVRRTVVRQVGPFDEAFWAGSDLDYYLRLLQADVPTCYLPEALLYHRAWRSADESLKRDREYHETAGMVIAKHRFYRTRRSRLIAAGRLLWFQIWPIAKSVLLRSRTRLDHHLACWRAYRKGMQTYMSQTPRPTSWREVAGAESLAS